MHLAVGLLPHFRTKKAATIMNVSSVLGYIPFSIINPVYNGSKAFVHFNTMNMRTQLAAAGDDNIKVVEIVCYAPSYAALIWITRRLTFSLGPTKCQHRSAP